MHPRRPLPQAAWMPLSDSPRAERGTRVRRWAYASVVPWAFAALPSSLSTMVIPSWPAQRRYGRRGYIPTAVAHAGVRGRYAGECR